MIVWFFHVKVGHRQTPIPKPPTDVGGFYFDLVFYLVLVLEAVFAAPSDDEATC